MMVNGYILREAIKRHNLELQVAKNLFNGSTTKFKSEEKPGLLDISGKIYSIEENIVALQTALTRFNSETTLTVDGLGELTLIQAIKLIGPVERMELLWRKLVAPKRDRYSRHEDTNAVRAEGNEYAQKTYTIEEATEQAKVWAGKVTKLRAAIATMNAVYMKLEVDPALIE